MFPLHSLCILQTIVVEFKIQIFVLVPPSSFKAYIHKQHYVICESKHFIFLNFSLYCSKNVSDEITIIVYNIHPPGE